MQMRTGAATAQSNVANSVAAANVLPGHYRVAGKMPIPSRDSVAVVKRDGPSITAHEVSEHYNAICRSYYRLAVRRRYVNPPVERTLAVEGIGSLAE
jgi:hypothetical protein